MFFLLLENNLIDTESQTVKLSSINHAVLKLKYQEVEVGVEGSELRENLWRNLRVICDV